LFLTNIKRKIVSVVLKSYLGVVMERIMSKLVEEMIRKMSPQMRSTLVEYVDGLEDMAETTKNPWDDILVIVLKAVLGI